MACPPRDSFQIGWICALPIELAAAKEILDEKFGNLDVQDPADSNVYTLGRIGKHHVVIACLPQYGTTSATTVANHMTRTFSKSLRIGLMVGVGGAIPSASHDIRLGDIVISCPEGTSSGVLQYDMGKIGTGGEFHRTGSLNSPPRALLTAVNLMRAAELTDDPLYPGYIIQSTKRNTRTRKNFHRPGDGQDRLFKQEYDHLENANLENANECDSCLEAWEEMRTEREGSDPQLHYGIIASGNAVIKDAKTREQLRLRTGALCFEMEAAGLMMDFPCIVIRGICDYADTHKNKQWQGYAALAAAAYAKELLGYVPMGHVSQENLVINVCEGFKEELKSIRNRLDQVFDQEARHRDEQKATASIDQQHKCHQAFKTGSYTEQKDINPARAPGTCQWALQSSQYLRWKESNHNDLLWISADPGCGKSVLARSIIDSYLHAASPTVAVCYFFFKENEEQNNFTTALCSILHQLFSQQPHLLCYAIPSWEANGQNIQKEVDELWRIFIEATSSDGSVKTICILDALDECREVDQNHFIQSLKLFHQQMRQPKPDCQSPIDFQQTQDACVKFLVTSRPYHHIQNRFREITDFPHLHLKGEEENDQIHEEIDLVVKRQIKELAITASLPLDVQQQLEKQLLMMENRTYLWLHLAIDDFRSTLESSLWSAKEKIQMIPPSVEKAYENILSRVPSERRNTVTKIFRIIIAARRPLTTRELAMALRVSVYPEPRTTAEAGLDLLHLDEKIRSLCGLFVFVKNSKVHLIHQTAREYLIKEASETPFSMYSCSLQDAEDQMAFSCLRYLSMEGLKNENNDGNPNCADFLEYAAIHWSDHVREFSSAAETEATDLLNYVYNLTADQFPVWFPIFWKSIMGSEKPVPILNAVHLAALNGHKKVISRLLSEGILDPNVADTAGSYPLTYASYKGHHDVALLLISHGAHVNSRDESLGNALCAACWADRDQIAQMLLEHGADANAGDANGRKPLEVACFFAKKNIVETLLSHGANVNDHGAYGNALLPDQYERRTEIMQILLKYGAHTNAQSQERDLVLRMACAGRNVKFVQFLLKHGFSVSCNLLLLICLEGDVKTVQTLLECAAEINVSDGSPLTALEAVCYTGNIEILHILLEHNAVTNSPRRLDYALGLACEMGQTGALQMLLSHRASFDNEDQGEATLLRSACSNGHEGIVQVLLKNGVDVNAQDRDGWNGLLFACSNGHEEVVNILLTHGADVHVRDGSLGINALQLASLQGHEGIVRMLLNYGADINIRDKRGWTVLESACSYECDKIVHILLSHKATLHAENYQKALLAACRVGNSKILHMLLTCGTAFTSADYMKALVAACTKGNNKIVHKLLRSGTALTSEDHQQILWLACRTGYHKIVRTLLKHRATLDALNVVNHQLKDLELQSVCANGYNKILHIFLTHGPAFDEESCQKALRAACLTGSHKTVQILLTHGIDVNSEFCQVTLQFACSLEHDKIVQKLFKHGADFKAGGYQEALQFACFEGHDKILHLLLDHRADITTKDRQNALNTACVAGQEDIVQILLEHEAAINSQSGITGVSALSLARRRGHEKIIKMLLEHGAKDDRFIEFLDRQIVELPKFFLLIYCFLTFGGFCAFFCYDLTTRQS
ncbi:unnamed protein product [Penicillium salamii]|uniref:Nucleoside phosphorylase domain-containing protein n=1 Tax=Penicillium salamii TaxID=1612424 RepID=A0A9W4NP41_9EURO|nr:unnamed protein product [Penicillium salamii]CAG8391462.1 unnamed protein product [Penicillium salamii]CAG8394614.1 unnamed protein product [Penicillium salamii]CAG8397929.1 unnamed protein product [Penicillium salamii]